jgi:hypothetical protein
MNVVVQKLNHKHHPKIVIVKIACSARMEMSGRTKSNQEGGE